MSMVAVNEASIERAAYLAANQIESGSFHESTLKWGSPGERRSRKLDEIARIIKDVMVKEMEIQAARGYTGI